MSKLRIIHIALFLALVTPVVMAQEKNATPPVNFEEYNKFVSTVDIKAHSVKVDRFIRLSKKKDAVILDLRGADAYQAGHIEGAILFGADISEEKLRQLIPSKDSTVLLYCTNSLHGTRMISLTDVSLPQLLFLGYKNTYILSPLWERSIWDWPRSYQSDLEKLKLTPASKDK